MSKHAKLSILLSTAWLVVTLGLYLTGQFSGNAYDAFLTYLVGGAALINLAVWGHRWITAAG